MVEITKTNDTNLDMVEITKTTDTNLGIIHNTTNHKDFNRITNLPIYELYTYKKLCEFMIDKLANAIRIENQNLSTMYMHDSNSYVKHEESENEKEFKLYNNIYNAIIKEIKTRLLGLTW